MKSVTAKLGTMRKAQNFTVQPMSDGKIMIQSDRSIGSFDPKTSVGVLNIKGSTFMHLSLFGAKAHTFPAAFVAECIAACPTPGGVTSLGGGVVLMQNTVQVVKP